MAEVKISEIASLLNIITRETLVAVAEDDGSGGYVTKKVDLRILDKVKICDSIGNFPATGSSDTIYVARDFRSLYIWDSTGGSYLRLADDAATLDGKDSSFYRNGDNIVYDNTASGLSATSVQSAIDELDGNVDSLSSNLDSHISNTSNPHNVTASQIGGSNILAELLEVDGAGSGLDADLFDGKDSDFYKDAGNIVYDNATSGLASTNVQAAIDEIDDRLDNVTTPDASSVEYDNTSSGLTATNVQSAIDELDSALDNVSAPEASDVEYDNASSGLSATNVQSAIDEMDGRMDTAESNIASHVADVSNPHNVVAAQTGYDNTTSSLSAENVQDAIDEVEARVEKIEDGSTIVPEAANAAKLNNLGSDRFLNRGGAGTEYDVGENTIVFAEKDNTISSGTVTVDWRTSNKQTITVTEDITVSFIDPSGACSLILKLEQDATGGHSVTLPTMLTAGGSGITLTTNPNAIDLLALYFDGSNYIASVLNDIK